MKVHFKFSYLLLLFLLPGCAEPEFVLLMPAPVVYHDSTVDPFAHLSEKEKTTFVSVFFATNRKAQPASATIPYGNEIDDTLHLGTGTGPFW